jgi:hypothetical protein
MRATQVKTRNGFERGVGDGLADLGQLHETDHRRQRRALDDLHQETHGGRDRDAHRLRQDHVAQLLAEAQRQALRGLPLPAWNGRHAAAPDLGQEGAGVQGQAHAGRHPGRRVDAEQAQAVIGQEQLHQQGHALEQLHVATDENFGAAPLAQAQHQQQQAYHAAADEGDQRQRHRPAPGQQQVAHDVPKTEIDHVMPPGECERGSPCQPLPNRNRAATQFSPWRSATDSSR